MNILILNSSPRHAKAYDLDVLAGCAGYTGDEFMSACTKDPELLEKTSAAVDPIDEEISIGAYQNLRNRMSLQGRDVYDTPKKNAFHQSYLAGVGAVLMQAVRTPSLKNRMTESAVALATAVALSLSVIPQDTKAENNVTRAAKDGLGALIGGALGSQIGGGNGKTAATAAGALVGVLVSESMMDKDQKEQGQQQGQTPTVQYPSQTVRSSNTVSDQRINEIRSNVNSNFIGENVVTEKLITGLNRMPHDTQNKLTTYENRFLVARDNYANSLYNQEINRQGRYSTQNSVAVSEAIARKASYEYKLSAENFVAAARYLGGQGYDVRPYAYSHHLAFVEVTARDATRRGIADISQTNQRTRYLGPSNEGTGYNP